MAMDLGLLRYPSFVYGKEPRRKELPPVLCLHTGQPQAFEQWCIYLSENNIVTLNSQDYADRLSGSKPTQANEVYLTFDDGHLSVWTVIEPLFRRYGLTGTTFLIPGRMHALGSSAAGIVRPTLDDVWQGRATEQEIVEGNQGGYTLATWAENLAMHERGHMDFQAHTNTHSLVVVSDEILGFITPELARSAHPFELAMLAVRKGAAPVADVEIPAIGTPIYRSASRMSNHKACFPAPEVAECCVAHVRVNGNESFFDRPDWQAQLDDVARQHHKAPVYETEEEHRSAIHDDLLTCRQTIEQGLPGKSVGHLAYPWGVGSEVSTEAARQAGYECAYWGRVESRLTNHLDGDPLMLARIGEDFFDLLPGKDRSSLSRILLGKFTRRLSSGSPYLSH